MTSLGKGEKTEVKVTGMSPKVVVRTPNIVGGHDSKDGR